MHLGAAVTCYICDKWWWLASTWFDHMENSHSDLGEENYFSYEGSTAEEFCATLIIKKEVADTDL